ncbi:MAG: sensor histidine kinase [Clostridia bacterium]|nr:sensor histidine kinase [Clostridia bacterium]
MLPTDKPYSLWETLLYAFLNSFPYMVLVLYSFRGKWRGSRRATYFLLALTTVVMTAGNALRMFLPNPGNPLIDVAISLIYIVFIFLAVKAPVGMLVFTVLVLMNLGNLTVVASKCFEGVFFPEEALLRYHWTYPLMMLPVLCILLPITYWLFFRILNRNKGGIAPYSKNDATGYIWKFAWLIPGVFYLIWMQNFYASGQSSLHNALDPLNTVYLLLIDLGSILIYRAVVKLVDLQEQNARLQTERHILSVQNMQYEHLKQSMDKIRQSRHDLRHQVVILKEVRESGDLAALDQLLERYPDMETLDNPLIYCANDTANAVISYYADLVRERGVDFSAKTNIPENLFVSNPDLAVLLGNLLENASEACSHMPAKAFIRLTVGLKEPSSSIQTLSIIVENSYCVEPHTRDDGTFLSTKHRGTGIGIASVRNIVARYNGACSFVFKDGVFTASMLLNYETQNSFIQ